MSFPCEQQQETMFGIPANPEVHFNVFHDERGTYHPKKGSRWLLHGILFVPISKQFGLFTALQEKRKETNYYEEIHYVKLRNSLEGKKAKCSKGWLDVYLNQFSSNCFYHCLAVDTYSPAFRHDKFKELFHAYNYFAKLAVVGGISWSLKKFSKVALCFYSDKKNRKDNDNFERYIPEEVHNTISQKRHKKTSGYPEIRLVHPTVISIISDPQSVDAELKEECELIQLVDLMTSNIGQSITQSSKQKVKIVLSDLINFWIEDIQRPPWLQTKELFRRFSVSFFPDKNGNFYNPLPERMQRQQLSFPNMPKSTLKEK